MNKSIKIYDLTWSREREEGFKNQLIKSVYIYIHSQRSQGSSENVYDWNTLAKHPHMSTSLFGCLLRAIPPDSFHAHVNMRVQWDHHKARMAMDI